MRLTKIIIAIFILFLFLTLSNRETVFGLTAKIEAFDTYGAGVSSGSNTYLSWTASMTGTTKTSTDYDTSAPNSLYYRVASGSTVWFNLSIPLEMTGFSIIVYDDMGTASNYSYYIYFYNETQEILRFRHYCWITYRALEIYDFASASYKNMGYASGDIYHKYVTWGFQNNYTADVSPQNYVYYYALSGANTKSMERSWNGSDEFGTKNLDRIKIYCGSAGNSGNTIYFDNLNITDEEFISGANELEGLVTQCSGGYGATYQCPTQFIEYQFYAKFSGTIRAVTLPVSSVQMGTSMFDLNYYYLYLNGYPMGYPTRYVDAPYGYELQWLNINGGQGLDYVNEYVITTFRCTYYVSGFPSAPYWRGFGYTSYGIGDSRYFNDSTLAVNNQIDGSVISAGNMAVCYYYDLNITAPTDEQLTDEELTDYKDEFGSNTYNNSFIQFYGHNIGCKYRVGDNPTIVYYVTNDYIGDQQNYYGFDITNKNTGLIVYMGTISLINDNNASGIRTLTDWEFETEGEYIISLYNFTNYGTTIQNHFYFSHTITVCEEITGGGGGISLPKLPSALGGLMGLIVTMFCTMTPLIVTKGLNTSVHVPPILYAITGALGISVSVMLGFFPFWVVVFIAIVGIIVLVTQYLLKTSSSGE